MDWNDKSRNIPQNDEAKALLDRNVKIMRKLNWWYSLLLFTSFLEACLTGHNNAKLVKGEVIPFDEISQKINDSVASKFIGWEIITRYDSIILMGYTNSKKDSGCRILFYIRDNKFKNLVTNRIFSLSDSNTFKREISLNYVQNAYEIVSIFKLLEIHHIRFEPEGNLVFFTKEGELIKSLVYDLNLKKWKRPRSPEFATQE